MTINEVQTYEDLERYLREFTNFSGDPVPYDFVGAYNLFLAILDNMIQNHIDADFGDIKECGCVLTDHQKAFLQRLLQLREFESK